MLCLLLAGCAELPSLSARRTHADQLAAVRGWQAKTIAAGAFDLLAYLPANPLAAKRLTIYVEGDGLAWLDRTAPASDPTPTNPLALRLALAQPDGSAAYLARPCQYTGAEELRCPSKYWTNARFAPEVITATNAAIDRLKVLFHAEQLVLVGYSGGAAVAALVAAKRDDIVLLVGVAGNLDHAAWTKLHRLQPLRGSLNPADESDKLSCVPQVLFVGGKDANIDADLAGDYLLRFPEDRRPRLHIEPEFDHRCCWVDAWPRLWSTHVPDG